jgi:lysine 6-dehydrogenase
MACSTTTRRSWVLRDGEPKEVDALSEIEPVEFPEPVGTLEAFHTAGGLSTMPWTYRGRMRTMEYKTLRYPGHADIMRTIRELGLLSLEPVDVNGTSVVPAGPVHCLRRAAPAQARRPRPRGAACRGGGHRGGSPHRVVYDLLDWFDEENGISAMERTTGFSLAITGLIQARRQVRACRRHSRLTWPCRPTATSRNCAAVASTSSTASSPSNRTQQRLPQWPEAMVQS